MFTAEAYRRAFDPWAFTARGRTHVARPVSAFRVVRFLGDAARNPDRALHDLLREAFPRPAWWRRPFTVDPVRVLLALEPAVLSAVMADFFRLPSEASDDDDDDAPGTEHLRDLARLNRDEYAVQSTRVALEIALLCCERFYGAAFVFNPARWRTADGWVPSRVLWLYWYGTNRARAWERMEYARQRALVSGDASTAAQRAHEAHAEAFE